MRLGICFVWLIFFLSSIAATRWHSVPICIQEEKDIKEKVTPALHESGTIVTVLFAQGLQKESVVNGLASANLTNVHFHAIPRDTTCEKFSAIMQMNVIHSYVLRTDEVKFQIDPEKVGWILSKGCERSNELILNAGDAKKLLNPQHRHSSSSELEYWLTIVKDNPLYDVLSTGLKADGCTIKPIGSCYACSESASTTTTAEASCNFDFTFPSEPSQALKQCSASIPYISHPFLNLVDLNGFKVYIDIPKFPRADGDEAQQQVLVDLKLADKCKADNTIVIDVGGLYGDFGLYSASQKCKTIIFEPQIKFAKMIAASIVANNFHPWTMVRNEAVSTLPWLEKLTNTDVGFAVMKSADKIASDRIPGVALDKIPENYSVYFLKVDVEGFEGLVINSGLNLFRSGRVKHAVFEYTPYQFKNRGTDYVGMLNLLKSVGAKRCYALHRNQPRYFALDEKDYTLFYEKMYASHLQTDVYCTFCDEVLSAPVWNPNVRLV